MRLGQPTITKTPRHSRGGSCRSNVKPHGGPGEWMSPTSPEKPGPRHGSTRPRLGRLPGACRDGTKPAGGPSLVPSMGSLVPSSVVPGLPACRPWLSLVAQEKNPAVARRRRLADLSTPAKCRIRLDSILRGCGVHSRTVLAKPQLLSCCHAAAVLLPPAVVRLQPSRGTKQDVVEKLHIAAAGPDPTF